MTVSCLNLSTTIACSASQVIINVHSSHNTTMTASQISSGNDNRYQIANPILLPAELILEITSHIISWQELRYKFRDPHFLDRCAGALQHHASEYDNSIKTIGDMRLACRYFSEVLKRDIFKAMVFDFHLARFSVASIESRLSSLSDPSHPSHIHTRFLRIHCLNPISQRQRPDILESYAHSLLPEWKIGARRINRSISVRLKKAFACFGNLRYVAWTVEESDNRHVLVLGAISSLPSLEDVTLYVMGTCKHPSKLQINRLSSLRSLSIYFRHPLCRDRKREDELREFGDQLAQVISQSPQLSHFRFIQCRPIHFGGEIITFQNIMNKITTNSRLRHLTSLRLQSVNITGAKQDTINLFKSVKYLHLEGTMYATDGLWEKMRVAEIQLHELTVNSLSKALHDYLSSFTTLQVLHVEFIDGTIPGYSTADHESLYKTILPLHGLCITFQPPPYNIEGVERIGQPHGIIYERRTSTCSVIHRKVSVTVCVTAIPRCLSFLMDCIVLSAHERLDTLEIRYSLSRTHNTSSAYALDMYSRIVQSTSDGWFSDFRVKNPLLYPKEVHLPYGKLRVYRLLSFNAGLESVSAYYRMPNIESEDED